MSVRVKRSWRAKLRNSENLPKVEKIRGRMAKKWGKGTIVIPAPGEVDTLMKKVPRGKLTTINEIRIKLANKHGTTLCCPLTTGIFSWIAAYAAEEDVAEGKRNSTPYWRTLKSNGELNPKYPGGVTRLKQLLRLEGHKVVKKGKKYIVKDFERSLV